MRPNLNGLVQAVRIAKTGVALRWHPIHLLWLAVALLSIALFLYSIPRRFDAVADSPTEQQVAWATLGVSAYSVAVYLLAAEIIAALGFILIALLLIARRPNNRLVWLASLAYITGGVAHPPTLTVLENVSGLLFPVSLVQTLGFVLTIALHLNFPTGQFVPRWTRIFFVGLALWAALWPRFPECLAAARACLHPWWLNGNCQAQVGVAE